MSLINGSDIFRSISQACCFAALTICLDHSMANSTEWPFLSLTDKMDCFLHEYAGI